MFLNKIKFNYFLKLDVNFYIDEFNSLLIKGNNGVVYFFLPSFYFLKSNKNNINFCFLNKFYFNIVYKQLFLYLKFFYKVYFLRLKLKGLGYRIKKYNKNLYRFFMGYNHFFYFYVPINLFVWNKKRNLLILSIDKIRINDIYSQLLLLKKLDFFEKTNSFINPKKILFIKK
jgi:hypothetical protein